MPFPILLLIDAGFTGATIDMPPLAMAHGGDERVRQTIKRTDLTDGRTGLQERLAIGRVERQPVHRIGQPDIGMELLTADHLNVEAATGRSPCHDASVDPILFFDFRGGYRIAEHLRQGIVPTRIPEQNPGSVAGPVV